MSVISDVCMIIIKAFLIVIGDFIISLIYMLLFLAITLLSAYILFLIKKDVKERLTNNHEFMAFIKNNYQQVFLITY